MLLPPPKLTAVKRLVSTWLKPPPVVSELPNPPPLVKLLPKPPEAPTDPPNALIAASSTCRELSSNASRYRLLLPLTFTVVRMLVWIWSKPPPVVTQLPNPPRLFKEPPKPPLLLVELPKLAMAASSTCVEFASRDWI